MPVTCHPVQHVDDADLDDPDDDEEDDAELGADLRGGQVSPAA